MQSAFMGSLMELAEKDKKVIYLTADSGEGGLDLMFRRSFPEQAYNVGIAEENLVGVAAGLAVGGYHPFVYTAAPFLIYRAYEFIRDDVCLQEWPVVMVGSGSGLSVSSLGPTHHPTEDIALLRSLPGLTVFSPATPLQVGCCVREAYRLRKPVYIRLGMSREKEFFNKEYSGSVYKNEIIHEGNDISIFSTGGTLELTMEVVDQLEDNGLTVSLVNVPCLKPFDDESVLKEAFNGKLLCVVEEHNTVGGLASIIADTLVDHRISAKLLRFGLKDCFSQGYGSLLQIRKENGLDPNTIAKQIMNEWRENRS